MGLTQSIKGKEKQLIKTSPFRRREKGGRKDQENKRNRTRGFVRTSTTHQGHYDDIDDDREYPPVTADDDYYYMNKDDPRNTRDKATCTTSEETFANLLQHNDNHDFNRPRSDSSYDSAFDDRSSRVSNKSLNDDVDNITRPDGPQLDETTKRYDSQEARIQQMVDAFRPIIEEIIRVTEVLPYLLFLDNTDSILAREPYSAKGAAGLLLDQLKHSQERGKWTTFLNALKIAGYEYLVNTLLGDTTHDTTDQKNILKIFTPAIINNLLPSQLIHHLFAKDVISQTDREEIECALKYRGTTAACLLLLDRVPRRHSNWYQEFITALKECDFKFLADKLDRHEGKMYLTPTSKGMPNTVAAAPSVPRRNRQPLRAPQKLQLENRRHSSSIAPKCHPGWDASKKDFTELYNRRHSSSTPPKCHSCWDVSSKDYTELYREMKQLILRLMDLKEEKRLKKDIKKLTLEYENALLEDDSDDEETKKKGPSASNGTSMFLMSSSPKPNMIGTSSSFGKSDSQSTSDDNSEFDAQTQRKQLTVALDKTMITPTVDAAQSTKGEEHSNQLVDDATDKTIESVKTETSSGNSNTLLPISHSTSSFNRAKLYRSFKDLSLKVDITGHVPLASVCRNSMCFDSGVGMFP